MIAFVLLHLIALLVLAAAAWGAGSIVARTLECGSLSGLVAIRIAAGLAALGFVFLALGLAGALDATASAIVATGAVAAGVARVRDLRKPAAPRRFEEIVALLFVAPLFALSLYPPLAFDETLYHLPTVERFAETGGLPFVDYLRMPVFPHLDEVLRVSLFQLGGDAATHLLSLLATLVTAGLMLSWFRERDEEESGWFAAALFLSGPLVVQLATTGYVEALMTMFVTAAFYAFDRWRLGAGTSWLVAAGAFTGCSASVKYLGLFWIGVLFLIVLLRGRSGVRSAMIFALAAGIALAPWYGRILYFTGNPIFPFASRIFGSTAWDIVASEPRSVSERLLALVRLPWDLLFARERTGVQPPFSPFLVALVPFIAYRALRDPLIRALALTVTVWCAVWIWLPPDARYFEPSLPLWSAAGALTIRGLLSRFEIDRRRAFGVISILVLSLAPLYALYRIGRYGAVPIDRTSRDAFLAKQVPEYGAIAFMNARSGSGDRAWLCGGEQLAYHYRGLMFGDLNGPASFALISSARDEEELDRRAVLLGARFIMVVKQRCEAPALAAGGTSRRFVRVYDDPTTAVFERASR